MAAFSLSLTKTIIYTLTNVCNSVSGVPELLTEHITPTWFILKLNVLTKTTRMRMDMAVTVELSVV